VEQSVGVSLIDPSSMSITQVAKVDMHPQIVTCCLTWCPIRYVSLGRSVKRTVGLSVYP